MRELALHILDLGENSLEAGCSELVIQVQDLQGRFRFIVTDNGRGMPEDFVKKLTCPFTTTRKTRKVGLGIPLLAQAAQRTGGSLKIDSNPQGTKIEASFPKDHLDLAPVGDLALTVVSLLMAKPDLELEFSYETCRGTFLWKSKQAAQRAAPLTLSHPQVANFLLEYLREQIAHLRPGAVNRGGKC